MNYLQKMIKELCPNGVEYKRLEELGYFFNGLTGKNRNDFKDGNSKYINYVNVYNNVSVDLEKCESVKVSPSEKQNTIQYGDVLFTGSSETKEDCGMSSVVNKIINENIYINSFCFGFRLFIPNLLDINFLKYLFRSENIRKQIVQTAQGVTRFNVSKEKMKKVRIPVPPIEIQKEIVKILDTMSFNIKELQEELQLRETQYEYYRDMLFNLSEAIKLLQIGGNIKFKKYKLSEIFYIKNGYTPSTKNQDFWENGTIPWFRLEDIRQNGNILSDAIKHVTTKAIKGEKLFPADSIILSTTATIGEHALIKVPCLGNQQLTFFSLKEGYEIDIKYMYYYFYLIDEWCKENTSPGTLKIVNMEALKTLEIELPSLEIQKRIVYILDNFETVCKDLKIGLPAEIEKRQIQYEYYRNMLLNLSEAI